ncbi:MAG: WD40 repeat domain-containing protein [Armatimonadetes bacterium]|nr:WD40 repeat domain-containing protein [Armatimonadota bacterium]
MYQEKFELAAEAYQTALKCMKNDPDSLGRLAFAQKPDRRTLLFPRSRWRWNLARIGPVRSLTLAPDGQHCISAGPNGLEKWNVKDGTVAWSVEKNPSSMAVLRTAGAILAEMDAPGGRFWDVHTGKLLGRLNAGERFLALLPTGSAAVVASDGDLHVRLLPSLAMRCSCRALERPIVGAAVLSDGERFASTDTTDRIVLWSLDGTMLAAGSGSTTGSWR